MKSSLYTFAWRVGDDSIAIISQLKLVLSIQVTPTTQKIFRQKRPNLSLTQFDKKAFMTLITCRMDHFHTDSDGIQLYDEWYGIIIDCVLRAGVVIKDGNGSYKRFDSNKNNFVSYNHKNVSRSQGRNKPWWDLEC